MTTDTAQPEPTDKTNKVLVSVVLDRSGSMESCRDKTIEGYNEYLNALRTDKESEYNITLIQFDHDAKGCDLTICYVDKPLADVPNLEESTYQPRGSTRLYDAIGDAIKALVKSKEAESQTFVFLGANIDAFSVGASFGAQAMNVSNYALSQTVAAFTNTAHSTMMRAASARTIGVHASALVGFYDDTQRASNMGIPHTAPPSALRPLGGRPAAPSTFRGKPKADAKVDGKPRNWSTNNS